MIIKKIKINITKSALKKIKYFYKKNPNLIGIKISMKKYGCVSWIYTIKKITKKNDIDLIYKINSINLYISKKYFNYINGIQIDYVKKDLNKKFIFNHKKIKNICGCGKSFQF